MRGVGHTARVMLCLTCVLVVVTVFARAGALYQFERPGQRDLFDKLTHELRCLVCQNESLADSGASLAQDLRLEIYHKVRAGQSEEEIKEFLIHRYGDFVLYDPPLNRDTLLLWFGPIILLLVAISGLAMIIRKQRRVDAQDTESPPSARAASCSHSLEMMMPVARRRNS